MAKVVLVLAGVAALAAAVVVVMVEDEPPGCGALSLPAAGSETTVVRGAGEAQDFCGDFADPFVLPADGRLHAFATNRDGIKVPTLTVADMEAGGEAVEALAALPPWAEPAAWAVWAPAALEIDDGFVLYYTAARPDGDGLEQCISHAVAAVPAGPYRDTSRAPLVCSHAGSIDPSPFVDPSGATYLLWKDIATATIVAQQLAGDGRALAGPVRTLLVADQEWEEGIVEGPAMVHAAGAYQLLYSANDWRTADYAIGHAVCDGPLGPCRKPTTEPWLATTDDRVGPGGPAIFATPEGHALAFHAWVDGVGYDDGKRAITVRRISFDAKGPTYKAADDFPTRSIPGPPGVA